LNLFRADKSRSISLPRKLKTAAYNPAHLAAALQLREILCSSPSLCHKLMIVNEFSCSGPGGELSAAIHTVR